MSSIFLGVSSNCHTRLFTIYDVLIYIIPYSNNRKVVNALGWLSLLKVSDWWPHLSQRGAWGHQLNNCQYRHHWKEWISINYLLL